MSKKIMIVDDSNVMRMAVSSVLKESGYEVVEADNGLTALEKAVQNVINLIICDVNMPVMNGLAFATQIKQEPDYRFVPIIMLTTVTDQTLIEAGKAAGVKAWMIKPFDKPKLLGAVAKLLG